jgi:[ribosomal protein S5]-alanine N-acetyltransferase
VLTLTTPRLHLVPTPLDVVEKRLIAGDFTAHVPIDHGHQVQHIEVRFPEEWPGDAIVLFPGMAHQLRDDPAKVPWGGTMIERQEGVAVGQMSFKTLPDKSGTIELGYGINPSYANRGYTTEMARELVAWAWKQPGVRRITAECLEDNAASIRVLEKLGFDRVGQKQDEEGLLILWQHSP